VVSDGGYIAYLADVLVLPEYQGHGIGSEIVKRLMEMVKTACRMGIKSVLFFCCKGKEGFYERFGIIKRPKEYLGHGMSQWVEK
jgi:GNAT superfamily N-acetyltransferase